MLGKIKRKAMIKTLYKEHKDSLGDIDSLDDETLIQWHNELKTVYRCFSCDGESSRPTGLCDWCKDIVKSLNYGRQNYKKEQLPTPLP